MTKQIVAHIPARTIKGQTKRFAYPARDDSYTCDDAGHWTNELRGAMSEADVIDACKAATNWSEIRAINFPMYGFHAPDGDWDNTPIHKADF